MGIFDFSKKRGEVIAVIDIGSSSVGGMLIRKSKNGDPEIITSIRVPANFLFDVDFQAFLRCVQSSLKKVTDFLLKKFPNGPDKVLCSFSLLWGVSQTRIIKVRKQESFELEKHFLEKLIENEIKIFWMDLKNKTKRFKEDPCIIEDNLIKVALNGYHVADFFGKMAKTIDAYVYISAITKEIKKITDKFFLQSFDDVNVRYHTRPFVIFSVLKNMINSEEGFLFADIGGDVTEISLVRRNILEETLSFPKGRNLLIRKIAKEFNTFVDDAESILASYRSKHASETISKKISSIIEEVQVEWRISFEKALEKLAEETPLPKGFFLVGDDDFVPEYMECVKDDSFAKFTILSKPFEVKQMSPHAFKHNFKFQNSFEEDKDVFLMIESLFANKFLV